MAAISSPLPQAVNNRRRRVRHKIQTPAYAAFTSDSQSSRLDLHEIVDISEDGIAIQCHSPLPVETRLDLCLDLAECRDQILTSGHVIWSNQTGRSGIRFTELPPESLSRLREWLFVNVMAGVANGEVDLSAPFAPHVARPNYTDTLAAITAVQRQVEALGPDLAAALQLIAERAQALLHATGAAIALADSAPDFMVCRASSGSDAPPTGARLQVGSGFSGECVKTGFLLRCDDTELDPRVDPETCRALGIRSILAAPIRTAGKSFGLIEALSSQPHAFTEPDERVLQRLAESVVDAANRAARAENLPPLGAAAVNDFAPPGSILFAAADPQDKNKKQPPEPKSTPGIRLPRSYLILLTAALATISTVLGVFSAPLIQTQVLPWIHSRFHTRAHTQLQTVLASTQPPKAEDLVATATLDQLRQMAERGDPVAQNSLGLRYATGDGVALNEEEAVAWFTKAAEQGNVPAQSKLGSIYYSGRGVPQDLSQAYFWMVVARLSGDEASKALSPIVRERLTRAQITTIELQADRWLRQQREKAKPAPGQSKSTS
jgi:TPR repeat protein